MKIEDISKTVLFQEMDKNAIEELLQYLSVKEKTYQKGKSSIIWVTVCRA